jgi:hypothetical protein
LQILYIFKCCAFMFQKFYDTHMHLYIYPWVLLVQDRVAALLRFIARVINLSLLTIGGYSYYFYYILGIGGCNKLCPAATGHNWVALFPCPC